MIIYFNLTTFIKPNALILLFSLTFAEKRIKKNKYEGKRAT